MDQQSSTILFWNVEKLVSAFAILSFQVLKIFMEWVMILHCSSCNNIITRQLSHTLLRWIIFLRGIKKQCSYC